MPPRLYSRYTFCNALRDGSGRLYLEDREPFRFQAFPDNIVHTVAVGDTLQNVAARYYNALPLPASLWWVVADFQPDPVFDPTVALSPGSQLVLPSVQTILTYILSEDRRANATG